MLFPWLDPVGRVQADHMTFRGEYKVESMSVNDIVLIKQLKKLERNMTGTDKKARHEATMHMHVHGLPSCSTCMYMDCIIRLPCMYTDCIMLPCMQDSHQIEVFACLTQEEALHSVFQRLINDIMERGIPTPTYVYRTTESLIDVVNKYH